MGYRIEYKSVKKVRGVEKRKSRILALSALFFLIFLSLVNHFLSEQSNRLLSTVLQEKSIVVSAMDQMARELQENAALPEVLKNFFNTVFGE